MRISKAFPHRRICISCRRKSITGLYCKSCKPFQEWIPSANHAVVTLFRTNPSITFLRDEFNFPSKKAVVNCLSKLRVPVHKYTLYFLLYNRSSLSCLSYTDLIDRYAFNPKSLVFRVLYHLQLPSGEKEKYQKIYEGMFINPVPMRSLEKDSGIHHELLARCQRLLLDRKIAP